MAGKQQFLASAERARSNELEADCEAARSWTLTERGRRLVEVCHSTWIILRARPDFEQAIAWQDPPAPDLPERFRGWTRAYKLRSFNRSHQTEAGHAEIESPKLSAADGRRREAQILKSFGLSSHR